MIYQIKAIPNSKKASVIQEDNILKVKINEPPINGRANRRLIEILARYFKTNKSNIRIVSGFTSRNKTVEILIN